MPKAPTPRKEKKLSAQAKAHKTARWARTMTKWLITRKRSKRGWEIVNFTGPSGNESRGIVDLMAIRKDHRTTSIQRGDFFEIILIQVKGGSAGPPTEEDIARLRVVKEHYHVRNVVLAEWKQGNAPKFSTLAEDSNPACQWTPANNPKSLFR